MTTTPLLTSPEDRLDSVALKLNHLSVRLHNYVESSTGLTTLQHPQFNNNDRTTRQLNNTALDAESSAGMGKGKTRGKPDLAGTAYLSPDAETSAGKGKGKPHGKLDLAGSSPSGVAYSSPDGESSAGKGKGKTHSKTDLAGSPPSGTAYFSQGGVPPNLANVAMLHPDKGTIVREFVYDKNGNIDYDKVDNVPGKRYARLHTVVSFQDDVATVIANTALLVVAVTSKLSLVDSLFTGKTYSDISLSFKILFCTFFGLSMVSWVGLACLMAHREFRALGGKGGDRVWEKDDHWLYWSRTFGNMVFFEMFNIPFYITDAPVRFHYATKLPIMALKSEGGARAMIQGYASREAFLVSARKGLSTHVHIIFDFPLILMQFHLSLTQTSRFMAIFALLSSILSFIQKVYDIRSLLLARQEYYKQLMKNLESRDEWTRINARVALEAQFGIMPTEEEREEIAFARVATR